MRTLWFLLTLLLAVGARASTIETAVIAVTNVAGTTNGQTITVASSVGTSIRTFTNNVVVPATQVPTNSTQTGAANNLKNQVALYPIAPLQLFQTGLTNIVLRGTNNFAFTVTLSAGWGTVTYSTNNVGTGWVLRVPYGIETAAEATNQWSLAADAFKNSTNAIDLNTGGTNDFGHTIFDDPASGSFLFKRASDGVTIGTFDGNSLTNLNLTVGFLKTNAIATWPTAAATPGGAAIINSNAVIYIITSTPGSTTWAATNKICP